MSETADENIQYTTEQPILDQLNEALAEEDVAAIRELLRDMPAFDIADLLESLPSQDREQVWWLIDPEVAGDVLSHAQESVRMSLLELMQPQDVVDATSSLDADDAADIIQDLPDALIESVLLTMDDQDRQRLSSVLSYPEDTAGGLMNLDVIPVRADVSLDVVSRFLRRRNEIPDGTDALMVVDRENKYLGILPLSALFLNDTNSTVGECMNSETEAIPANQSSSDVAKLFEQRDFVSAPVVDEANHLLGRITVDDIIDVIQEETEQTFRRMAGIDEHDIFAPIISSARRRAVWLGVNLITAFIAAAVIGRFEATIQQLVALAVLMPIVASMGGVAGIQTLTITVRGLALGQVGRTNFRALLNKELGISLLNGILWAVVVALLAYVWFGNGTISIIIGIAMVITLALGAVAGAVIPLMLKQMGIDPAVAGGVLLTTVTDVVGFLSFLGLATLVMMG